MKDIGALFDKYGSDKNTNHSYGPFYQTLFPDPLAVQLVMEIGIASGAGLLAYHEFFENAQVVGFDKEPCHRLEVGSTDAAIFPLTPRPDRLEIHQGDMRSRADLLRAVNHRHFDLIAEDASHQIDDNLRTLFWLWPWVAPGGIYVIEELGVIPSSSGDTDCIQGYLRDSAKLFAGAEVWESAGDHPGELLLCVRKPRHPQKL